MRVQDDSEARYVCTPSLLERTSVGTLTWPDIALMLFRVKVRSAGLGVRDTEGS
jgi:hypothetical protein